MRRLLLGLVAIMLISTSAIASKYKVDHLEPISWWVGMKNPKLQLLIHGKNISELKPEIDYAGVTIESVSLVENPNYLFVNLHIDKKTVPGSINIEFKKGKKSILTYNYKLNKRRDASADRMGYSSKDVMYLITPDRFANGDYSNDNQPGMIEQSDRTDKDGRHGGDIQGIINSLDYLKDMGFTAVWVNPLLEDNQPEVTYHGYAITDYYQIDKRYGTNEDYVRLSKEAKKRGIGVIMDVVLNHCGSAHWWMKDMPSKDWINFNGKFTPCSHKRTTVEDAYASQDDKKQFSDGWFVESMPDLNQRNPYMANYLTQNAIWWIEYADLMGLRVDTYPYSDKTFLSHWSKSLMDEYPNLNIVGEEWSTNPLIVSYWQKGKVNSDGYISSMPSMMDFPLNTAMIDGFKEDESWNGGFVKMYEMLANDFVYPDARNLVIFPDNHDMARIYDQLDRDDDLFKMTMAYTLTMRGIPQIFYGTEILAKSEHGGDHGYLRIDFPGGWKDDKVNAFTGKGLSKKELDAQQYMKKLLNWRKNTPVIHDGQLMHYAPQDGVYAYFRYDKKQKVMVVFNKNTEDVSLKTARFHEMLDGVSDAKDVITGKTQSVGEELLIPARSVLILEVK
ncbi:glycoside hydrolase family 13 protein [Halosquirtibacter xylanolyticus]|uniref:glycoside hydrolase family 13 protein n=1 Tax=Halosquirtibacter xylanolyticus TaxID=3374599 RepID=UPI0037499C31|nr:glycoside hydrolase family 13 protein [Prolixibacteraceae bacterium]